MASAAPTTPAGGGSSVAGGGGGGGGGRGLGEGTAAVGTVISGEDDVRQLEAALSKRRRQFSAHHLKVCMQVAPLLPSPPSTTSPIHRECTTGMRARVPGTMQESSLVHYTSRGTTASHDSKQCQSTRQAEFAPHDNCCCWLLFMLLCCIFQAKFKYACMLTDSGNNKRVRDGVALLQGTALIRFGHVLPCTQHSNAVFAHIFAATNNQQQR